MERIFFALLLVLISPTVAVNAADTASGDQGTAWVDPGWRRTVNRQQVTFDEQGLSVTIVDFEIQALDEKGAEAISQQNVDYNSYFDELTVEGLATVKADGSVLPVDDRAVRDQPASADTSSPYFDERRLRIIAYPFVAPGDRVRGRLTYTSRRPRFAGEFARYWSEPADRPPEAIEVTLDGPASKPLHIAGRSLEQSEQRQGDRIVHHVRLRQETPKPRQMDGDAFDDAQRIEVSTFADYAAFAAVLNARNAPMAQPDAALRKLSTEIVGDAADVSAKVERIHNWVARNIRYVGIGFEDGGLTSQPAAAVLAARYGDCKAHATILKALLAAQGIKADLVAVNAEMQYTLTEVATPNFDHAIVYVPQIDQYLDPTAPLSAFGSLPPRLNGKPVLNIDRGTLASIPVAKPERFALAADTEYTLADDGTRTARSILSGTGVGAMLGRAMAQNLEKIDGPSTAKKMIESAGLSGSGDYSFPNPRELSDSYAITTTFQISSAVDRQQAERVRMLPLTDVRPSLAALTAGGASGQPFPCRALEYRETSSLTVPEGTSFYEKPAPLTYLANINGSTAFGRAHGRIEVNGAVVLEGRTLRSSALVRLTFDAAICPAEFAAAIKAGLDKFAGFKHGPIGLTPSASPDIADISPEFSEGVSAFQARNYKLALARLKPFAETGNAKAQSYVGTMYETGRGVELDRGEAIAWFQKAAGQGDAYSQSHLGYAYEGGLGVARDEKLAAEWYAKAAEQGYAYGEERLAGLYRDGRGLTQDFEQAAKWFGKAADQGSAWAQMNLGLLYIKGQGVPLDYTKGMYWLHKAADRNDSYAQYNLGWAYESGTGVPKDREEAIKWYRKASNGGNQEAGARLAGLTAAGSFWGILFRHLGLSSGL
jgi:TPR repeat protein/transglutaminase-like putative cysteine protease